MEGRVDLMIMLFLLFLLFFFFLLQQQSSARPKGEIWQDCSSMQQRSASS